MPHNTQSRKEIGLPPRPFLYHLDQIAAMLEIPVGSRSPHIYWTDRSIGKPMPDKLRAQNIAAPGERPEWRVSENELIRWCRKKGFRVVERGWVK